MKKIRLFIQLVLILCMATACTNNEETAKTITPKIENKSHMELIPIQIPTKAEIVFFNNQKLYYYTDVFETKTPENANKTLNEYDFNSKTSKPLFSVADITTYSASFALNQGNIYLPFSTNNVDSILVKANMKKGSTEIIKKWKTFPPLAYVYILDNNLILFGPNEDGKTTNYYINKIDLTTNKEEKLIEKKRKFFKGSFKGEMMPCMDVDDKYIYTFSIKPNGKVMKYEISQYDVNGKLVHSYPFDLKVYFGTETLEDPDDGISDLYKEKDYFILKTLGGRVFIFKVINNKLQPIKLPAKLYTGNPAGFHFLEYYDGNSDFAYFTNPFIENNIVTVFDYSTEKLTTLEFPKNDRACFYTRNASGDLILKKPKGESTSEFEYFYYKNPVKQITSSFTIDLCVNNLPEEHQPVPV